MKICYNLVALEVRTMVDYQKMYYILCRAASDAIDILPENDDNQEVRQLLQNALLEAEELYISARASNHFFHFAFHFACSQNDCCWLSKRNPYFVIHTYRYTVQDTVLRLPIIGRRHSVLPKDNRRLCHQFRSPGAYKKHKRIFIRLFAEFFSANKHFN